MKLPEYKLTSDDDMDDKYRWLRTAAVLIVVGLGCLAMTHTVAVMGREGEEAPVASEQATLVATAVFPAIYAKNVCPDTPLHITFASAPIVGAGEIQVLDASNDALVETINVSVPIRSKSIGGLPNFNYYPIITNEHVASIYLSHALAYDKTYYVKIDPGAFKSAAGRIKYRREGNQQGCEADGSLRQTSHTDAAIASSPATELF